VCAKYYFNYFQYSKFFQSQQSSVSKLFFTTSMDDNETFEDCLDEQSTDTVSPLDDLKEWIKNHGKFPKNIRKFNVRH
jgi:hypothetical protein